jgi:hypothetical protein
MPLCVPSSLPAVCLRAVVGITALAVKPESSRMSALSMRTIVLGTWFAESVTARTAPSWAAAEASEYAPADDPEVFILSSGYRAT